MALLGGVALYFVGGFFLDHVVSSAHSLGPEIRQSFGWIASILPLTLVARAGAGPLESRELFVLVNSIYIGGISLSQIAPVIVAVFASPSLTVIILAAAVSQAFCDPAWKSSTPIDTRGLCAVRPGSIDTAPGPF